MDLIQESSLSIKMKGDMQKMQKYVDKKLQHCAPWIQIESGIFCD